MHVDFFLKRHLEVILTIGLIFLSAAFLFMKNDRELDPDYRKSWWVLAFEKPDDTSSTDFIVTNHTPSDTFTYEIRSGTAVIESGTISIPRGASTSLHPHTEHTSNPSQEIRVWPTNHPENNYSIYRK